MNSEQHRKETAIKNGLPENSTWTDISHKIYGIATSQSTLRKK